MNPPHILIVDDEPNIRFVLEHSLKHKGYIIDTAANGEEALEKIGKNRYDLLLLDLHMEPIDGMQVLHTVRKHDKDIVVIILTAYSSVETAVEALRLGAFDYLFKPANSHTICQRVHDGLAKRQESLQRRSLLGQIDNLRQMLNELDNKTEIIPMPDTQERFIYSGKLVIDHHHRQATLGDIMLDLTSAEFELLICLVVAAPSPLSPRQLVKCTLGYDSEEKKAKDIIKWHIHHLRRKIEPDPSKPHYIKTVRHKGYLWRAE